VKLHEIGEFGLIEAILSKHAQPLGSLVGNDCAIVPIPEPFDLVITSDKGSQPLIWNLPDVTKSFYQMGWLTAIAGISDLATEGAKPLCATNNIVAPSDFEDYELEQFAKGFCSALEHFGFQHAGGDLSEGESFSTSATFLGLKKRPLANQPRRSGEGVVCVVGELGTFAASYLRARRIGYDKLTPCQKSTLSFPTVPFDFMHQITDRQLLTASVDASDGVDNALNLLANRNNVHICVNLDDIKYDEIVITESQKLDLSVEVLAFSWGNWQQVILVEEIELRAIEELQRNEKIYKIGTYSQGKIAVEYRRQNCKIKPKFCNHEAFRTESYFNKRELPFL
jgi:thiamine monophosphate kinase